MNDLVLRPEWSAGEQSQRYEEWERTQQWLAMLAGLRYVDVLPEDNQYWGMCERADQYDAAKNDLASDIATEHTRLLYAWSSVERVLRLLRMPDVPDRRANNRYNQACQAITNAFPGDRGLEHYACAVKHLTDHATREPSLRAERPLQDAGQVRPWRSSNSLLLSLGNAMRNIPAHGAVTLSDPEDWSEDSLSGDRALPSAAHAPRVATRGLLLSLQQLLIVTCDLGPSFDAQSEEFGWPVRTTDGGWKAAYEPTVEDLLRCAHLLPPDADTLDDAFSPDGQ